MIIAEWGSGQVLWSVFWFAVFAVWFGLVVVTFVHIIRADDLSGPAKAAWFAFVLFLPYIGVFVYLAKRGALAPGPSRAPGAESAAAYMRAGYW